MFTKLKLLALSSYIFILGLLCTLSEKALFYSTGWLPLSGRVNIVLSRLTKGLLKAFSKAEKRVIQLMLLVSCEQ